MNAEKLQSLVESGYPNHTIRTKWIGEHYFQNEDRRRYSVVMRERITEYYEEYGDEKT